MRIGIDARGLRPALDGIGRYTRNLVRGLLAADRETEYVLFILPDTDLAFLPRTEGVTPVAFPHRHLSVATVFRFGDTVRRAGVDLLHIPFFVGPRRYPVPTIVTVHDLMALTYPGFFSGRNRAAETAAAAFHRLFVPGSVRRADLVFADSEHTRKEVIRAVGVPPERTEVIYPFVEDGFRRPVAEEEIRSARERLGISRPYLLYYGSSKPYKNLPGLVSAYARLLSRGAESAPDLVMVGPPDRFRARVETLVRETGAGERVRFGKQVPDEVLVPLLKGAVALCFPSFEEGFGLPVLEAMTVGTPVITSRTSSLPEVAGEAALLVDPTDPASIAEALGRIACDQTLRRRLISLGRRQAERFEASRIVGKVLAAYRRVAEARR